MTTQPEEPQALTAVTEEQFVGDVFDDWLKTGTIGRRTVTIYADVEAGKRLAEIDQRLTELTAAADDTDAPVDAPLSASTAPEIAELEAEAEVLLDRLEDSKSVWTVRAVSQDEVEATYTAERGVVSPKMPVPPPQGAAQKVQERYAENFRAYAERNEQARKERRLHLLVIAVETIETARGTREGVTLEQLHALQARPHGQQWIDTLYQAVQAATEQDVEPPRPTSPGRSGSGRG